MSDYPYKSDRWVTPSVLIVGLLVAGGCIALTIAAVAFLTVRGLDPDPMLKLVGIAVTAAGSVGSFVLQLVNRRTVTKTERNTGVLANKTHELAGAVYEVADAMPRPLPRHSADDNTVQMGATPAPPRE